MQRGHIWRAPNAYGLRLIVSANKMIGRQSAKTRYHLRAPRSVNISPISRAFQAPNSLQEMSVNPPGIAPHVVQCRS